MVNRDRPLAINGGDPSVTIEDAEQWEAPLDREKQVICELIDDGLYSGSGFGPPREFETAFGAFVDAEYCLSVDHGTHALASAYYAVGVGPGDEVITPAQGFTCSYSGAIHLGARPVFCDLDPETLLADPDDVERRITDRTRAINIVHWQGMICDMDAFRDLSDRYDVPLVVDGSHAHGATWGAEPIGTVGDITAFSLQGHAPDGKPICGGEGGVVTTNDRELFERQLTYCHLHRQGILEELTLPAYRIHDDKVLGYKWRAHPFALAIAHVSMESVEYRNERRRAYRTRLYDELDELPGLRTPHDHPKATPAGFYNGLHVVYEPAELNGLAPERFGEALLAEGVPLSGPGFPYPPQHLRPIMRDGYDLWGDGRGPLGDSFHGLPPYDGYENEAYPIVEALHERVFTIPCYIDPKPGIIEQMLEAFERVIDGHATLLSR